MTNDRAEDQAERVGRLHQLAQAIIDTEILDSLPECEGLSKETLKFSVRRSFRGYMRDKELLLSALQSRKSTKDRALIYLPSNTIAPLLNTMVLAYLADRKLALKISTRNVAISWAVIDLILKELFPMDVQSSTRSDEFLPANYRFVAVFGQNETVSEIRSQCANDIEFAGFGQKLSIGYIEDWNDKTVERAVDDIVAWNQFGCLSPQTIFVKGRENAAKFARALSIGLAAREDALPRGSVNSATALEIRIARMNTSMCGDGEVAASERGTAWSVLFQPELVLQACPLARTVNVRLAQDRDEFVEFVRQHQHIIETVGVSGDLDSMRCMFEKSTEIASRLGEMQSPSLLRRHGGLKPLFI
ncbi:MAG: hypothetical protein JKX97_05700 [Candidatus Lindowbacteria bacterium]|nr:hypothetical protein [Candidatus Lindowbacteria bacterium]